MNNKLLTFFLIGIILFSACNKVTEITLNKSELSLIVGDTVTLIATIYPANATNKKITWTSLDPSVASVNNNGVVTALSGGSASIMATSNQNDHIAAFCSIYVYYENYFGDWDFVVQRNFIEFDHETGNWKSDTINCLGKISQGNSLSALIIEYFEKDDKVTFNVSDIDEFGKFGYSSGTDYPPSAYTYGKFEGNSNVHLEHGIDWGDNKQNIRVIDGTKR